MEMQGKLFSESDRYKIMSKNQNFPQDIINCDVKYK